MDGERLPTERNETGKLEIYRERVTKMETQIEVITIEQKRQETLIERMTTAIEKLVSQIAASELQAVAIRERTDQHTKTIERLQERETDISKILEGMKLQLSILRYIGGAILTLIIGYVFSHYIR